MPENSILEKVEEGISSTDQLLERASVALGISDLDTVELLLTEAKVLSEDLIILTSEYAAPPETIVPEDGTILPPEETSTTTDEVLPEETENSESE